MVNPRETQTTQLWADPGLEMEMEMDWDEEMGDTDDFLDGENFPEEQHSDDFDDTRVGALASWRRIEIARENRKLRSLLNDLGDYDEFEYSQDDSSSEYSY